jgi:hypothetical protein
MPGFLKAKPLSGSFAPRLFSKAAPLLQMAHGHLPLTTPLNNPPMKLSKLRLLCDKAFDKYGDIDVVSYDADFAFDVTQMEDGKDFSVRLVKGTTLPGESLDGEEPSESTPFLVLFCN